MLARLGLAALFAVSLAACEPKAEEPALDGAPGETPAPSGPVISDPGLAGAPTGDASAIPALIGIDPPAGMTIRPGCEHTIAPDYSNPPAMTCLSILAAVADAQAGGVDTSLMAALNNGRWRMVREGATERYFERDEAGTDCADVMALVTLDADQTAALIKAAGAAAAPKGSAWRAWAIPASTRKACGADRTGR
jgi:hypothetical protein